MKKTALAGAAALTLLDISASTPVHAQSASVFTGIYTGGHVGHVSGDATFMSDPYRVSLGGSTFTVPGRTHIFDLSGTLAGAHAGLNFVFPTNILIGVESDWTELGINTGVEQSGRIAVSDGFAHFIYRSELEMEWQATVRGRLGFVAGNALFFATAGVAWLRVDWDDLTTVTNNVFTPSSITGDHSAGETLVGTVVGGGVEFAVTPTVIIGSDYLFEDFESFNSVPHGAVPGLTGELDNLEVHKVRFRVSVKFGGVTP